MKSKYNIITRKAKYINSKSIKEILIKLKKAWRFIFKYTTKKIH